MAGGAPRAFGFEGQRGLSAEAPQSQGKQRPYSSRVHPWFQGHWDPGQSSDSIGAWARPTCGLWRVSCGDRVSCGSLWSQGHWWWTLQGTLISVSSPGGRHFGTETWPHQQPAGSSAGTPQSKQPTGWEHSPTHQQTGCLKSS